jgi:hypothetical protein
VTNFQKQHSPLLGKQVKVTLDAKVVIRGKFLCYGDSGEFVVEDGGGFLYYCWPMLEVEEIKSQ